MPAFSAFPTILDDLQILTFAGILLPEKHGDLPGVIRVTQKDHCIRPKVNAIAANVAPGNGLAPDLRPLQPEKTRGFAFKNISNCRKWAWVYGDNFVFWGMIETKSCLEDAPNEISLYATEGYWQGEFTSFRRYTLRIDGFVSAQAPLVGGELVTKPLTFNGSQLEINFATSAAGSVRVEIQDASGQPIPGFALADCHEQFGDQLDRLVSWSAGTDGSQLAGKAVRLRFALKDADLYSFQFAPKAER